MFPLFSLELPILFWNLAWTRKKKTRRVSLLLHWHEMVWHFWRRRRHRENTPHAKNKNHCAIQTRLPSSAGANNIRPPLLCLFHYTRLVASEKRYLIIHGVGETEHKRPEQRTTRFLSLFEFRAKPRTAREIQKIRLTTTPKAALLHRPCWVTRLV